MQTNTETPRDFADKNVVVTGGAGALGRAVVEHLVARGAHCHVPRRGAVRGEAPDGVTFTGGIDLGDEASVNSFYGDLPPIWASVHLAGGFAMAPIADTSVEQMESMWRTNTLTCFLSVRAAVSKMREAGGGGRIVNVIARPVLEPAASMAAYAASKAGVWAITGAVAEEVRDEDILVNAIVPSLFDTPANREAMPDADHSRWPKPSEIAVTIAALASPKNRLTTGTAVPVYGKV